MPSMRYISPVPAGFLVRKAINGRLYQSFFGETRYGSSENALKAAVEYRDKILEMIGDARSFQHHNSRNVTGIVGVGWHCRENTHRKDAVVHSFRAQVAGEDGNTITKAWSVQRHGLWRAYEQAARWRYIIAMGVAADEASIVKSFVEFLNHYINVMESTDDRLVSTEMRDALVALAAADDTPKDALIVLPANISKRFAPKKKSVTAQILSGQRSFIESSQPKKLSA